MVLCYDVEANGLLDEVTSVHCLCGIDINTKEEFVLAESSLTSKNVFTLFSKYDKVICHNQIGYDIPLIKKMLGIDLLSMFNPSQLVDTYIWSCALWPDRVLPKGCPTSIKNPVTGRSKKIGPHGLEAWGYRVGNKKIEIHDWREYTPEILIRCLVDVDINIKTYYELLKEIGNNK